MSFIDWSKKMQIQPRYDRRSTKLDQKDNEFTSKKFQQVRKVSTHGILLKSLKKIGKRLNNTPISIMPIDDLDKVCFILINDYNSNDQKLGVGPLNDGYLIALRHHQLGYKVFYLYNPKIQEFPIFLQFFINNTTKALTIFYTGSDNNSEGIEFKKGSLSKSYIENIISPCCNGQLNVIFISDTYGSGSVFDIKRCSNAISLSVEKTVSSRSKEFRRSHGIFTYYLCKMIGDSPRITPKELVKKMNPSLSRFNEFFTCEFSDNQLGDAPIFAK